MDYRIDVFDTYNRRIASYDEVPLFESARSSPDEPDLVSGILPGSIPQLSPGFRIAVSVADRPFCDAVVKRVMPHWSDTRKLILDRYVYFHEVIAFEAERIKDDINTVVSSGFANQRIDAIVRSLINTALGPVHYTVAHSAYPDGAQREFAKFAARKVPENELEVGGIDRGQWVGPDRIDASAAYAKDGDTISGIVVDGIPWPDIRLIMTDSEELTRNSHAIDRHPEVVDWSEDQYAASGYKIRAEAAKQALQSFIDASGIDFIELNSHRDVTGEFDDRVDFYGRYIALVYGGGLCFNAAQVELGHADIYLWEDGAYHVPEMELKDFFSYMGPNTDSIESISDTLAAFDVKSGIFEVLTALTYAGDGSIWTLDPDFRVSFRRAVRADRVISFDPVKTGVALGADASTIRNVLYFDGNPFAAPIETSYSRWDSIDEYGRKSAQFRYFALSRAEDAARLTYGLLNDLAYPEPCGSVEFYHGDDALCVGDILEFRDAPLRRIDREIAGEWGERFQGKIVARVRRVTHRFSGKHVTTVADLTSPLRSVADPLTFIVRRQETADHLYQFRLDTTTLGLDMGYHLD